MPYRFTPDVIFTELKDGTAVLLHLQTKLYYTLNPTGFVVGRALAEAGGATEENLAGRIHQAFEVELPQAQADVRQLLQELVAEGLATGP